MVVLLTLTLAVTQILDYRTTTRIIDAGGKELNPVMRKAFEAFGMRTTLAFKGVLGTAIGYWIGTENIYVLGGLVVFYIGVIAHNYRSMK